MKLEYRSLSGKLQVKGAQGIYSLLPADYAC